MKNKTTPFSILCLLLFIAHGLYAQNNNQSADKIFVDMGYQSGIGDFATDYFNVHLTYGKQTNQKLFYGIGTTLRTNQLRDQKLVGAFLNTKSRLVSKYKPLLVDIGIGYNFELEEDFKEGGVLFFAGLHNEITVKKNLNFYCAVTYDVMRLKRFGDLSLYRSYNAKVGLSF